MNHLTIYKHRVSRIRHWASCGENPTLVHFRHFRHFSSLLTNLPSTSVENALQITPFYAKQSQFSGCPNERKFNINKGL